MCVCARAGFGSGAQPCDGGMCCPHQHHAHVEIAMCPLLQAAIDAIDVACGLSLGEYTALAFAGAIG